MLKVELDGSTASGATSPRFDLLSPRLLGLGLDLALALALALAEGGGVAAY